MIFVHVMIDHLSLENAFAGQKRWSLKTGSTVLKYNMIICTVCDRMRLELRRTRRS